ncbi:hypothetical protein Ade02nite_44690 [Paractinoplanes deccanensis]|uniref:Uncharacterized protein n=1 Tax=Paractinoplanes deccanensis TaxID=113561 RepID=A0ABQ3Y766_9ACTN|nr:hypothetical protein [Actinoplanes deccanensis]GID75828.1 hypothetical protein Ade02nite_44690 [Actinoplanes deccanensis]
MFGRRGRALPDLCTDLADAVIRLDERGSAKSFRAVVQRAQQCDAEELSAGLVRLSPALEQVALGNGGQLAGLAAALVEIGADPLPVLDVLVERVAGGLELAAQFGLIAGELGDVAAPTNAAEYRELRDRVVRAAPAAGLAVEEAGEITQAWFTVNDWIPSLLLPLQHKRARLALPHRDRLTAATAAVGDQVDDAPWLHGLLLVLDDEPLLVLHRETGRAYDLKISGIGDNFQLHTLLAAALIGEGRLPGTPPAPAWVAAATTGEMMPEGGIQGQFNLVDARGAWIWNEGRPAGIPLLGDHRVVVLDPPPYARGWNAGRAYPLMTPEMTLVRTLPAEEAAGWLARVAPSARFGGDSA